MVPVKVVFRLELIRLGLWLGLFLTLSVSNK